MPNAIGPVSQPVVPAQPNTEFFSVQDLALFRSYSRDSYRAAFGVQVAAYDPARLRKSWFDSTVDVSNPNNVAIYYIPVMDQNGRGALQQMVMPAQEAATVNLPGTMSSDFLVARSAAMMPAGELKTSFLPSAE